MVVGTNTDFDFLPFQIAFLDEEGTIIYVNKAWRDFANDNGYDGPDHVSTNYLKVCDSTIGAEKPQADSVSIGIQRVIDRELDTYEEVYPCHSPVEKRWFKVYVTRKDDMIVVCHANLSKEGASGMPLTRAAEIYGLIHDLRSPVTVITGYVTVMKRELSKPAKEQNLEPFLHYLEKIENSSMGLLDNINKMLDVASGKASHMDEGKVYLPGLLNDLRDEFSVLAAEKNVGIELNMVRELTIKASASHMRNIMVNLISNAIKYNNKGGMVMITVDLNTSCGVDITVADNGIGIPEDKVDNVFAQFERINDESEEVGTGIGLANVYRMISELEGLITVKSELDVGSTFKVSLPNWRTM